MAAGWSQALLRPGRRASGASSAARPRYDAFISYSSDLDPRLAPAIQRGLHRFAKPWYRTRALRVFRDTASLSANPALWPEICSALDNAGALILLASPESAHSHWVDKEFAYWCANRPKERLTVVLCAGEIVWDETAHEFDWSKTTALPPAARGAFSDQPLYVDMTWTGAETQLSLRNPRFADAVATIAAPLHGCSKDELGGEDVRQHRRTIRTVRTAITVLALLTIAAVAAAVFALSQRNQARTQRGEARSRGTALLANSFFATRLDRALLLSMEAFRAAHTSEARSALVRSLEASDSIEGFAHGAGEQPFTSVTYSARTGWLAGASGGSVYVWNATTRKLVARLRDRVGGRVNGVAFSPTRGLLAWAGAGGTASLWVPSETPTIRTLPSANQQPVKAIAFSRDGTRLALGREQGIVEVVPLRGGTGTTRRVVGGDAVNSVAFGRGFDLAAGSNDGRVTLWHAGRARTLSGPGAAIQSVAFSPDGRTLAAGGDTGALLLFDVRSALPLQAAPLSSQGPITAVAFAPDGQVAEGTSKGAIDVWSLRAPPVLRASLRADEGAIHGLAYSPDGRLLAAASGDGTVVVWDTHGRTAFESQFSTGGTLRVVYDSAGELVSGGSDGRLTRWVSRAVGVEVAATSEPLLDLAADPVRLEVTGVDQDGAVVTWRLRGRDPPRTLVSADPPNPAEAVAINAQGSELAVGRSNGDIELWARSRSGWTREPRPRRTLNTRKSAITTLEFSPKGSVLVVGTARGSILLVDVRRRSPRWRAFQGGGGMISAVAISPDGGTVATGSADRKTVDLWKITAGLHVTRLSPLAGHNDSVTTVAFSRNGATLASGSADGTVILSDPTTHRSLGLPLQTGDVAARANGLTVNSVAFSPDGEQLVTATSAGLSAWGPLPQTRQTDAVTERLCRVASRNLTRSEWQDFFPGQSYHPTCPDYPAGGP